MKNEEFNRYCADVMGYTYSKEVIPDKGLAIGLTHVDGGINYRTYNPATDLNQMAKVFDKLWQIDDIGFSMITLREKGLARAMREFIESTRI